MPNHLGYCGSDQNEVLFDHATRDDPDPRLAPMLAKFTGAFPYLKTIAERNRIPDPFDARVVEAYWIGNDLLEGVEARELSKSLEERFGDQLTGALREQVLRKPPEGARPFHFFHVVDVYRHLEPAEVGMAAMEDCRISWGQVREVDGAELVVDRRPLVFGEGNALALGEPRSERVLRQISGRGFADDARPGNWVSIHWKWVCEVLDRRRLENLRRYTRYHLELASRTM